MKTFQIWIEGYLATGMEGNPFQAELLATIKANAFDEACDKLCAPAEWQRYHGDYDPQRKTVWGRRLYDNERAARALFG